MLRSLSSRADASPSASPSSRSPCIPFCKQDSDRPEKLPNLKPRSEMGVDMGEQDTSIVNEPENESGAQRHPHSASSDVDTFRRYVRLPVEVRVRFAATDGHAITLEGPVAYVPGDAIVTGTAGETWPIQRRRFERTYEPADPKLQMGTDGIYRRRREAALALRLYADTTVVLSDQRGRLHGRQGDWLVQGPDGDRWIVADAIFQATYARVTENADDHHHDIQA